MKKITLLRSFVLADSWRNYLALQQTNVSICSKEKEKRKKAKELTGISSTDSRQCYTVRQLATNSNKSMNFSFVKMLFCLLWMSTTLDRQMLPEPFLQDCFCLPGWLFLAMWPVAWSSNSAFPHILFFWLYLTDTFRERGIQTAKWKTKDERHAQIGSGRNRAQVCSC